MDPAGQNLRMAKEHRPRSRQDRERYQVFQNPARPGQVKGKSFSERPEERDAPGRQTVLGNMEKDSSRQPQKERSQWGIRAQKERISHSHRRRKPPVGDGPVGNTKWNVQIRKDRSSKGPRKTRETGSGKKCDTGGDDPVVQMFHGLLFRRRLFLHIH